MFWLQSLTSVNPTVYNSIRSLAEDETCDVVIFSGSDRSKLEETFGELNVWLAAENGMYLRSPGHGPEDDDVSLPYFYFCQLICAAWCDF